MTRQWLEFTAGEQKLLGVLHLPARVAGPAPVVLMLHGCAGNKIGPHRMHVQAATALAAAGIACLRFDCRGSGDSEGDFRETTLSRWLDDAVAALDVLAEHPGIDAGRLGAQGYSLGGAAAALLAGRDSRVRAVCLWAPVADLALFEDLGHIARLQGQVDLGGDRLSRAFFADLDAHDPVRALTAGAARALVVHGTADADVDPEHARAYFEALGPGRCQRHLMEGAGHGFDAAHWVDELVTVTANWWRACWPD